MSQILLFGGSFNPPHLGHLHLIKEAFRLIPTLDELWLVPCYQHSFGKDLAPAKHRLKMCKLLINDSSRIKVCPIEIDHQTQGSTYQTLQLLRKIQDLRFKIQDFSFLMGSDQLPSFTKWQNWEKLLEEMTFYVYPRPGFPMEPLYPKMIPLPVAPSSLSAVSSSTIRQRLANHQPLTDLVPPAIEAYLNDNHLY